MTDKERIEGIGLDDYEKLTCLLRQFGCKYDGIIIEKVKNIQNAKAVDAIQEIRYYISKNIEKNYGLGDKTHYVIDCEKLAKELNRLITEYGGKNE